MKMEIERSKLKEKIQMAASRMAKAEREKNSVFAYTAYAGVIGVAMALPIVVGAYLGHWLDCQMSNHSIFWTPSLILVGVFVGIVDVYLLLRE